MPEDFNHALSKVVFNVLKKALSFGGLHITENKAEVVGNLTYSLSASIHGVCRSLL